jgi:tetratricopeptide (TPR) repeat protein
MRWLRPCNIHESLKRNLASRIDGTCEWILKQPAFREWAKDETTTFRSRILLIHGVAGCGKSVLGSFIYSTLQKMRNDQTVTKPIVLYYSFSAGDMNRQTLDSLARTLLSELLQHDHGDRLLPLLNGLMERSPPSTFDMFDALQKATEMFSEPIKAIVDGIDECSDSRDEISRHLINGFHATSKLDLIILGQSHVIAKLSPSSRTPVIEITPAMNNDDMQSVVKYRISQCPLLSTSSIREDVSSTLLVQADGMLLWAKLMLDYLGASLCDNEVLTRLSELPKSLEESYSLILDRLAARLDKHQQRLVDYLFSFTVICARPLKYQEVQHAYALIVKPYSDVTQSKLGPFLLRLQPEEVVDMCGGLLTFTNGVFRLVHNSVRNYLTRPEEDWVYPQGPRRHSFRVDLTRSHRLLSDVCLRFFRETDLSQLQWENLASLDLLDTQEPLLNYVCLYLPYHLNRSKLSPEDIREKFLALWKSRDFFFALECVFVHLISEPSMQLQMELWTVLEIEWIGAGIPEFLASFELRCEEEHNRRISDFGETDPRTVRWSFCREAIMPYLIKFTTSIHLSSDELASSEETASDHVKPEGAQRDQLRSIHSQYHLDPKLSAEVHQQQSRRNQRPEQHASYSIATTRVRELLQVPNEMPLGRQLELAMRMLQHFTLPRGIVDPLVSICELIKKKSASMSLLQIAGATLFYYKLHRNNEAFEIGNIYLQRMNNLDTTLNILVQCMMGVISNCVGEDELAIELLQLSLAKVEKSSGFTKIILSDSMWFLALTYENLCRYEEAVEVHKTIIKKRMMFKRVGGPCWIRAHLDLGRNLFYLGNYQDALSSFEDYLAHYKKTVGEFKSFDFARILEAFRFIAGSHFYSGQENEALKSIQKYWGTVGLFKTEYCEPGMDMKRMWAQILVRQGGASEKQQDSIRDALQDYISSNCKEYGQKACYDAREDWLDDIRDMFTNGEYTPEHAFSLHSQFWNVYEDVHNTDKPFSTSHCLDWEDSAEGYSDQARYCQSAGQHLEARQLVQKCLNIYHDNLAHHMDRLEYTSDILNLWTMLSVSEKELGNYLPAAKAAWKALTCVQQLTECQSDNEEEEEEDEEKEEEEGRLKRRLRRLQAACYEIWRSSALVTSAPSCRLTAVDEEANDTSLHARRVRRTRSLCSIPHYKILPRSKFGATQIDALLLVQHQEYLEVVMQCSWRPRSCVCFV